MGNLGLTNPAMPGEITQAGMLVCVSDTYDSYYPKVTKPDTSALATGFRQTGVLAELPQVDVGRDTEPVTTGVYGIAQEILFKGYNGKVSFTMYGTEAGLIALGLGITPIVTIGTTKTTTAVGTDATTGYTSLTFASDPVFTVGQLVQVSAPANVGFSTNFARVRSSGTTTVLDRKLREVPIAVSSVSPVTSVEIPFSGAAPKYYSFCGLIDYPDGRVLQLMFPKVYSSKAITLSIGAGQDAVKTPVELTALGSMVGGSTVQIGTCLIWP
jgi:hypothetical protein